MRFLVAIAKKSTDRASRGPSATAEPIIDQYLAMFHKRYKIYGHTAMETVRACYRQ